MGAAGSLATGLSITETGIRGLPGVEQPHASLIWIAGMVVVAAGCAAYGLALNGDLSRAAARCARLRPDTCLSGCSSGFSRPTHVANVLSKLQVENRAQAAVQALKRGVISLEDLS